MKIREKEIDLRDDKQKIEAERLVKKDEHLIQIAKELVAKEKELKLKKKIKIEKILI